MSDTQAALPFDKRDAFNRYARDYMAWRCTSAGRDAFAALKAMAGRAVAAGRRRIGVRLLIERARWEVEIERRGQWKLNNNFAPLIARDLIADMPELADRIELRTLRA